MIEVLFAVRKDQFKANPVIQPGLDLVDENDQYTHMLTLDDPCEPETVLGKCQHPLRSFVEMPVVNLDVFKYDEQYEENEEKYKEIRKIILDEESNDEDDGKNEDTDEEEQVDETESKNIFDSLRSIKLNCFLCSCRRQTNDH